MQSNSVRLQHITAADELLSRCSVDAVAPVRHEMPADELFAHAQRVEHMRVLLAAVVPISGLGELAEIDQAPTS